MKWNFEFKDQQNGQVFVGGSSPNCALAHDEHLAIILEPWNDNPCLSLNIIFGIDGVKQLIEQFEQWKESEGQKVVW